MRVLICGIDGYLGWPLAWELLAHGHQVGGLDNYSRRLNVEACESMSLTPIEHPRNRLRMLQDTEGFLGWASISLHTDFVELVHVLDQCRPDAIVHLAEMPSAPWSMKDRANCIETHNSNMVGTINLLYAMMTSCPEAHLVKLGTMGEYGTPNVDIPEGTFELEFRGRKDTMMFPKKAGSWYHLTKVHDSHNIEFACRNWGLRSTDIMQGVVYGVSTPTIPKGEEYLTRFDYDECFGTAINRFCAQAIADEPITIYGVGGQTRGWIPLRDSVECLRLTIENPPEPCEYRVFNQFANTYSVQELAEMVLSIFGKEVHKIVNPRMEAERHYYNPDCKKLHSLGYVPTLNTRKMVEELIKDIAPFKNRILKHGFIPKINWRK